jgi:hypothetical protein
MRSAANCAMCGRMTSLCNSHLLPKSLYKLMRSVGAANPNPLALTPETRVATSRQTTKHLLCSTCENRLSASGEKYVLAHCLRQSGAFPLRDLAVPAEPQIRFDGQCLYHSTKNVGINIDALRHFAAGVFWKTSVAQWRAPVAQITKNLSGDTYWGRHLFLRVPG